MVAVFFLSFFLSFRSFSAFIFVVSRVFLFLCFWAGCAVVFSWAVEHISSSFHGFSRFDGFWFVFRDISWNFCSVSCVFYVAFRGDLEFFQDV